MNYPNFIENKKFYSFKDTQSELEHVVVLSENLKKIHNLSTQNFQSFDQLIMDYLRTGLGIFGMQIGIVSQIKNAEYIVCNAITPDNSINKGDVFPLDGTYCREVFNSKKVLAFPHVGSLEEMKDHPVYENMKLESYISAPIFVDGKLFGTFNFTSKETREYGFSEHERDLISLMANSIGSFLMLANKEAALVAEKSRMKDLMGYVSHDLRNPLGNVLSLSSLIELDEKDEENKELVSMIHSAAERALEMVHSILDMAATGTGKIKLNKEKLDITILVWDVVKTFSIHSKKKNINIDFNKSDQFYVEVDKHRMGQVFQNLISNAIKYAPENSTVSIKLIRNKQDKIDISISNKVDQEAIKVVQTDVVDFNKSVGFGLVIVKEILSLHGSQITTNEGSDNYYYSFTLD